MKMEPVLRSFQALKQEAEEIGLEGKEGYAENASWEKNTWAIKLSALLTGRAMDIYTRMSDADANDYDKLKKVILTRYNYTEHGYRKIFREVKPEEIPSQVVRTFWKQFWRLPSPSGSDSPLSVSRNSSSTPVLRN